MEILKDAPCGYPHYSNDERLDQRVECYTPALSGAGGLVDKGY